MANNKFRYPNYKTFDSRVDSFKWFDRRISFYEPEVFARAGFFWGGTSDHLRCYCCGIGLRNWAFKDVPSDEHLRWSPDCKHMAYNVVDTNYAFQYNTENTVAVDIPSKPQPPAIQPAVNIVNETSKPLWSEVAKAVPKVVPRAVPTFTPRSTPAIQNPICVQPTSTISNKSFTSKNIEEGFKKIEECLYNAATILKNIKNSMTCEQCHKREPNIVFLPCRHSDFCDECVNPNANMCLCQSRITSMIKKEKREDGATF